MTLNEYIISHADRGGDESFLRQFGAVDVYFSIQDPPAQLQVGPLTASQGVQLQVPVAKLDIGSMAVFYASKQDARLSDRFAGMPLVRAAQMVCAMPHVDGMLIQSEGDAWFVALKEALRKVAGQIRA
jgi:hypothetical protein